MELKIAWDAKAIEQLIRQYPEAAQKAQEGRVTEALKFLEGKIKEETPVGGGPIHLRDTIFSKVSPWGQSMWGMISTPAVYGESVEMGTKPHFPPVEPIRHWVEKKLGYDEKEAKSIAFLIARAISKRGTQGAKMFTKSFERHESQVISILNNIPGDIVRAVSQ